MESQTPIRQPHSALTSLKKMHKGLLWSCCTSIFKYGGSLFYVLKVSNGRKSTTERTESSVTRAYCRLGDRFSNMEVRKQFTILWKLINTKATRHLIIIESYGHIMELNFLVLPSRILRPRERTWFTLWSHSKISFFWFPWWMILVWIASNPGYLGQWKNIHLWVYIVCW